MKKVIFIHIPRTAGTTLGSIIDKQYNPDEIKKFYGYSGGNIKDLIEEFKELPAEIKDRYKFLCGHMEFGLHQVLGNGDFTYITLLREPTERIISLYYYILERKTHPFHKDYPDALRTLKQYVSSGISTELNNGQTRLIAGEEQIPFRECSQQVLEKALYNIKNYFSFVGIAERLDESAILLKMILGYKISYYRSQNIIRERPKIQTIPKDVLDKIKEYNLLDYELYHFARAQFLKKIKLYKSFQQELYKLKTRNYFHNNTEKAKSILKKLLKHHNNNM